MRSLEQIFRDAFAVINVTVKGVKRHEIASSYLLARQVWLPAGRLAIDKHILGMVNIFILFNTLPHTLKDS
jgi:hypothetical protein